ncbi:HET-domain-containing protein [Lepidopterella palustris CBS 459.81]|uniref:HET-domain-containing protein n=1 Tax=Lepidopterella palustris CBS 459.81 TaxID=1314670 RepID=A0A8E2DXH4_9PEZI|nr:HET-domain-containing protein [Lepidopterella palustris CBS 459.81]
MLCQACIGFLQALQKQVTQKLRSAEKDEWVPHKYHSSYTGFKNAIMLPCAICKKSWSKLRTCREFATDATTLNFISTANWCIPPSHATTGEVEIALEFWSGADFIMRDMFALKPAGWKLELGPVKDTRKARNTGEESLAKLSRFWVDKCQREHKLCQPWHARRQPTRLVYIDRSSDILRLCEGDEIPKDESYVSLSHCWGKLPNKIILTQANISKWRKQLPPLKPMQTFIDAIDFTRKLGISYIWIDSLCIIQDSEADWRKESTLMSEVYLNALVNITASWAADDSKGCYVDRDPEIVLSVSLLFKRGAMEAIALADEDTNIISLQAAENEPILEGQYRLQWLNMWHDEVLGAPVSSRGWIVQERFLAPRLLYFTQGQLCFECCEMQASESYPGGFQDHGLPYFGFAKFQPSLAGVCHDSRSLGTELVNEPDSIKQAMKVWAAAVHTYSAADLTFGKDKLVAISGVAKELAPSMHCRYLAGHWEHDLERQLGWRGTDDRSKRPIEYRAPSWAWTSVDGCIRYFLDLYQEGCVHHSLVEIQSVRVTPLSVENPFGQITGGVLKLRGQLISIEVQELDHDRWSTKQKILVDGVQTKLIMQSDQPIEPEALASRLFAVPLEVITGKTLDFGALVLEEMTFGSRQFRRIGWIGMMGPFTLFEELGHTWSEEDFDNDPLLKHFGKAETGENGIWEYASQEARQLYNLEIY